MDALINSGFPRSSVFRLEGNSDEIERVLLRMGTEADKAKGCANDLPNGGALVAVRVAQAQIERAVKVIKRYARIP